ncbi:MAG: hypothetical protein KJ077_05565 [Anaerolineae bacterium]|nr:hypothetical protein [Anaerolineae bacterium]
MDTETDPTANQIRPLVEQIYESEGLTDALTDEAAGLLLQWGEQQLQHLAHLHLSQADLENAAHTLQQAMRTVNHLMEQRAGLSDVEMIQYLIKLVDQVITLTLIAQQITPLEHTDGQETEANC